MKNVMMSLILAALVPAAAQAKVITCWSDTGEVGLSSFKFNPKTKRASGHYDNLDEGKYLSFSMVSFDEGKHVYGFQAKEMDVTVSFSMLSFKAVSTDVSTGIETPMTCQ